jgi:hypothetical protein
MISCKAYDFLPENLKVLKERKVNLKGAEGQSVGSAQKLKHQKLFKNVYGECLLDCYLCNSLKKDIFLGFSWFETLNPRINWATSQNTDSLALNTSTIGFILTKHAKIF